MRLASWCEPLEGVARTRTNAYSGKEVVQEGRHGREGTVVIVRGRESIVTTASHRFASDFSIETCIVLSRRIVYSIYYRTTLVLP